MRKNINIAIGVALLGLILILLFPRLSPSSSKPQIKEKILLDTLVTIKAYGKNKKRTTQSVDKAFKEMARIEKIANNFDPKSEISMLNKKAGRGPVKISHHLFKMIELSINYHKISGGTFDITIWPLIQLWSFGERKEPPSKSEILNRLSLVDTRKVNVDSHNQTVSLAPNTSLDLGGISKGYAVDRAIVTLAEEGINSALVTTGSTTRTLGQKPKGQLWKVGIQHPRKPDKLIGIVELDQKSISTSGDYQRFFTKNGRRYHHILNPKTGYPAEGIMSVTIITDQSCTEADILSTGVFVLGFPQGMEFIESKPGIEGIIITSDRRVHISRGLHEKTKNIPGRID